MGMIIKLLWRKAVTITKMVIYSNYLAHYTLLSYTNSHSYPNDTQTVNPRGTGDFSQIKTRSVNANRFFELSTGCSFHFAKWPL